MRRGLNVLVVDGGGRGHGLAWKLRQSPLVSQLFVAPGNAGTARIPDCKNVAIGVKDIHGLLKFATDEGIDITVVGSDDALAADIGIVNLFESRGLRIFGPTKKAAEIEWSKVFFKDLARRIGVPTAPYETFEDPETATAFVAHHFSVSAAPLVIKAEGLAAGKGVRICNSHEDAVLAIRHFMIDKIHGDAGVRLVMEKFIIGREVSIHLFSDGETARLFPAAQDHKQAFDNDKGDMTGGMGTFASVPWFAHRNVVSQNIIEPILREMKAMGREFRGVMYPALMVSETEGAFVLEVNARPGDSETQTYMRLLKTDLMEIILACIEGRLREIDIEWTQQFAACIVLASAGYPGKYESGFEISGIEDAERLPGVVVFHAGTSVKDGKLVTSGGRVLGVTGIGHTLKKALDCAYEGVSRIHFEGMQYRSDIGKSSLALSK